MIKKIQVLQGVYIHHINQFIEGIQIKLLYETEHFKRELWQVFESDSSATVGSYGVSRAGISINLISFELPHSSRLL
jgi:hypothetical protein